MNNWILLLILGVAGLGIAWVSLHFVLRISRTSGFGNRSIELHHSHRNPISRLGGIGLAMGVIGGLVIYFLSGKYSSSEELTAQNIMIPSLAMFILGLWDDLKPIGAKRKLLVQIAIASLAFSLGINVPSLSIPFTDHSVDLNFWLAWGTTVLWLVSLTNLINLIDGVDGLAGGISLMLMILLVYVGGGNGCVSFIAITMAGALIGFLRYNFPPATIYMGDGGAYFIGFLIGCLTIVGSQKGTVLAALIAPLFVLALPILDTSLAIVRRGLHGLPLFRPDRRHIHHRLLEAGLSRRRVVLGAYLFTGAFLALGFLAFWSHGQYLAVLMGFGTLIILFAAGRLSFSREWFAVGRILGNSLAMRSDIQYAMAQTRWLVMEGDRCHSADSLCEDIAFIARKLGFCGIRIKLGGEEREWQLAPAGSKQWTFNQALPGHPECTIQLQARAITAEDVNEDEFQITENTFPIISELLAEGWAKSLARRKNNCGEEPRFGVKAIGKIPS